MLRCEVCGRELLTISWSSLRTQEECKQKARLYKTGKKSPVADIRVFFPGTVVDRVMRDWLNASDQSPGDMALMVEDVMNREELAALESGDGIVRWKHRKDRDEALIFCRELVVRLEPILQQYVLPYEYEPAKRFRAGITLPDLEGKQSTIALIGEMDLLVKNDDGKYLIWDLKGTKDNNYWRKTIGQLVFYDLSTFAMFNEYSVGGGLLQPMCDQRVMPLTVTNEQRIEMMRRIISMAHSLWKKDYSPREDTKYCTYCPVRHACVKFTPVGDVGKRRMSLSGMQDLETQHSISEFLT